MGWREDQEAFKRAPIMGKIKMFLQLVWYVFTGRNW